MKSLVITILIYLVTGFPLTAQNNYTGTVSKLLDKYFEVGQLNGVVLIAEKNDILFNKAYGHSDFDAMEAMKPNSVFMLASVSKTITSLGILKLVESGKISLDDGLTKFFPELPYENVTIRHLISNTSGIPEYGQLFIEKWDRRKVAGNNDVIEMMAAVKPSLQFEPGTQFRYSNTGFAFAASVIEKVTGLSYEEYMNREIFAPLNMQRTLIFTRDKEYEIDDFAFPFIRVSILNPLMVRPETVEALSWINYLDSIRGDVSTASCAEDLFNMDRALTTGNFLQQATMNEIFTPAADNSEQEGYGYGWFISKNKNGEKIVSHEGGMPGISVFNLVNLADERTIIVLSNTNYTRSARIAENIASVFEGDEPVEPKPSLAVELEKYIAENGTAGLTAFGKEAASSGNYELVEADINMAGYRSLQQGNTDAAVEIFKLNVEFFPGSWNVYDSLGEGYMVKGNKELAVKYYKKSLEINPDNINGQHSLQILLEEK